MGVGLQLVSPTSAGGSFLPDFCKPSVSGRPTWFVLVFCVAERSSLAPDATLSYSNFSERSFLRRAFSWLLPACCLLLAAKLCGLIVVTVGDRYTFLDDEHVSVFLI